MASPTLTADPLRKAVSADDRIYLSELEAAGQFERRASQRDPR